MKILLAISCTILLGYCKAQNLIPNPGFEEKDIETMFQWVQPQGDFYHYEKNLELSGVSNSGNYFNGICMYNYQENEYLTIKLKEPLKKGNVYCASFFIKLYEGKKENYELTDKIGWYFSTREIQSNNLINLDVIPQVSFFMNDTLERTKWQYLQNTFESDGTETYLTVGYFNSLGFSDKYNAQQKDIFLGKSAIPQQEKIDYSGWNVEGKKNKNKKRELDEFRKKINEQSKIKPINGISKSDYFSVRYYFDDFCLASIEQSCNCDEKKLITINIGENFILKNILFETNSSILLPIAAEDLNYIFDYMSSNKSTNLKIKGHTDNEGTIENNLKLSLDRAKSVKEFLIKKGINGERLETEGYGFLKPIDNNNTDEGKLKNRRVEFEVIDK
jgi:outer membrane protein OmpA-like peptidoglycan-associated protein